MNCELYNDCPYAKRKELSGSYCTKNPYLCARRRVAMSIGKERIPTDLLPVQSHRILDIIFKVVDNVESNDFSPQLNEATCH